MIATKIVDRLLETGVVDPDDPSSAVSRYVPVIRTGRVMIGDRAVHKVRARDGEIGIPTGGTRRCDCGSIRFGVRWTDGKLTWICAKAVDYDGETAIIL